MNGMGPVLVGLRAEGLVAHSDDLRTGYHHSVR
jgi:hypothetical protein